MRLWGCGDVKGVEMEVFCVHSNERKKHCVGDDNMIIKPLSILPNFVPRNETPMGISSSIIMPLLVPTPCRKDSL